MSCQLKNLRINLETIICCRIFNSLIFSEISEEKSRNQTLEQELMEAKITIQELRKHQLQPQESYYQNHSNQYESDSISGRSTPEPKPIIGKFLTQT